MTGGRADPRERFNCAQSAKTCFVMDADIRKDPAHHWPEISKFGDLARAVFH